MKFPKIHTRAGLKTRALSFLLLTALMGAATSCAQAAIITAPPGINAGDTYRLAFVTSIAMDATSSDINVYNTFAQSVANSISDLAVLGATWSVIGSTEAVNAIDNINWISGSDVIYGLDGILVSDPFHPLFASNSGFLDTPIPTYEDGSAVTVDQVVWTGTYQDGTSSIPACCTVPLGAETIAFTGITGNSFRNFAFSNSYDSTSNVHVFYAISSEITAGTPEPGTTSLAVVGSLIFLLFARHKRRT